jgi:hypothetical protein
MVQRRGLEVDRSCNFEVLGTGGQCGRYKYEKKTGRDRSVAWLRMMDSGDAG